MKRLFFGVCMVGLFSLLVLPSMGNAQEPIRIGLQSVLSGAYAQPGEDFYAGAKLYLEEVKNTMAGRKVEVFAEDEEGNPTAALTKAKRQVEMRNIKIFLGPLLVNTGYAVAPYLESKKIPMIFGTCADDVTQRKTSKYIVRSTYTSSQSAHAMGDYAYRVLGYRKAVILAPDYAFGWEVAGGFQKVFEDSGGKIIQKLWFPFNINDFSPYLAQINKEADVVWSMLGGKIAMMELKQAKEYGLKTPILGLQQITDESILPEMGDEALGILTAGIYSAALDTPINKKFVGAYVAKYGRVPSHFSELMYTMFRWVHVAADALKGDFNDPEKVMVALKGAKYESARGPVKIDPYGQAIQNVYIRKCEKVGGAKQNTVIYTYPEVSQFWKYKPEEFLKQPVYSRDFPACPNCK